MFTSLKKKNSNCTASKTNILNLKKNPYPILCIVKHHIFKATNIFQLPAGERREKKRKPVGRI